MLADRQAVPGGPSTPGTPGTTSSTSQLTPAQQQQINDGVKKVEDRLGYGYSAAAAELANQLRGQTTGYQAQFISTLNSQMPPMLTTRVLRAGAGEPPRFAGEQQPTAADQQLIAQSVGAAYDQGLLPSNFAQQLLTTDSRLFPSNNEFTANLVSNSGSQSLKLAYVDQAVAMSQQGGNTASFATGAAIVMSHDPTVMQTELAQMSNSTLQSFVNQLKGNSSYGIYGMQSALTDLYRTGLQLTDAQTGQPSSTATRLFFDGLSGGNVNGDTQKLLDNFFNSNSSAIVDSLPRGSDGFATQSSMASLQRYLPNLTGNWTQDAQNVANWMRNKPQNVQTEFVHFLMSEPFGANVLRSTYKLSSGDQQLFASAIDSAYQQNPNATLSLINKASDAAVVEPVGVTGDRSGGLASIIGMTGDASLIGAYATHELQAAQKGGQDKFGLPGQIRAVDAMTALGSLNPSQLQDFLAAHKQDGLVNTMMKDAGSYLGGPGASAGFLSPWVLNPALGNLLNNAAQIRVDGKLSSDALDLFRQSLNYLGDNPLSQQGAGAFFMQNARQIVDTYAVPGSNQFNTDVLKQFFSNVVFSRMASTLQYNGKPLVDQILGNSNDPKGGILSQVSQQIMGDAINGVQRVNGQPTADSSERLYTAGKEVGYLIGAAEAGYLQNRNAQNDENAKSRDQLIGSVGSIAAVTVASAIATLGEPEIAIGGVAVRAAGLENLVGLFTAQASKAAANTSDPFTGVDNYYDQVLADLDNNYHLGPNLEQGFSIGSLSMIATLIQH